jgi:hypothetical protein
MALHAVLMQNRVAADNIDALNRSAIAGSTIDLDNGNVFRLDTQSTTSGQTQVWNATVTGSGLGDLWMAASPEVVITVSGTKQYSNINPDPQDFYNLRGKVFDAYKPQKGDVITQTAEAFTGTAAQAFANSGSAVYTLHWAAAQVSGALSYRYLATTYIALPNGSIGGQRVTAYKMECIHN